MSQLLKEIKSNNTSKVLELLQSSSLNLNEIDSKTGNALIHIVIENQNTTLLTNLLSKERSNSADPNLENEDGMSPLICAVHANYIEGVDNLLRSGAKPNAKISDGRNALHFAAELPSQDILKKLIKAGIQINANSPETGGTPLHKSIIEMNYESALILLEQNDINLLEFNADGDTPLHVAVINGAGEVVDRIIALLEKKADEDFSKNVLNNKNKKGNTPLHEGEIHKRPTICGMLTTRGLKLGLDIKAKNKEGKTAEDLKNEREQREADERQKIEQKKKENVVRNKEKNEKKKNEKIEAQKREEEEEKKQKVKMESAQKHVAFLERFGPIIIFVVFILGLVGMYIIFKIREEQGEIIDVPMEEDDDEY